MKFVIALFCLILLQSCCGSCQSGDKISTRVYDRQFEVVEINRPKHFSVTLLDVETHELFYREGSSKHCNTWNSPKSPKLHSVITAPVYEYYYKDDPTKKLHYYIDKQHVNKLFCH